MYFWYFLDKVHSIFTVKCPEDQAEDQTEAIELRNIHVEAGQEEGSKEEQ